VDTCPQRRKFIVKTERKIMEVAAAEQFKNDSDNTIDDKKQRTHLLRTLSKYNSRKETAAAQYDDHELAKKRAAVTKWKSLDNLDAYLIEFEANFIKSGGKVIWAQNDNDAVKEILAIIKRVNATKVLKSKSLTIEEIGLLPALKKHGIDCENTDVGEFIQKLSGESTYHPALPAVHKTAEEISKLIQERFTTTVSGSKDIVAFSRAHLRNSYLHSTVGITGANYLVADVGAVSMSEDQGNSILEMAEQKIHIIVAGIDKVVPSMLDLDLFWPLHSTHSIGKKAWTYNSLCFGPRSAIEAQGPDEMFIILIDNGRSNLLEKEDQRKALSCIRCGACMNACPVFQNIGGHAYGNNIGGPIGSVTTPYLKNIKEYKHLTFASTLCGSCTDVCPMKIDLHKMLSMNRNDLNVAGHIGSSEQGIYYFWKKGMLDREKMNKGGASFKNFLLSKFFKKAWGKQRYLPKVAAKSFNEIWREKHPSD
jgi:L-lactate dehydrogenase complex protein LldF